MIKGILYAATLLGTFGLTVLISALFADGTLSFAAGNFKVRSAIYFVVALFVLRKWKPNPILVMLGCGIAELAVQLILRAGWL